MRVALAQQLGGIGSVALGELPDPVPGTGQALVRVHGAGVGPWDVGFLGGGFPGIALPFVPGQEVAGTLMGTQQCLDPAKQCRVPATGLCQVHRPLGEVGDLQGGGEDVLLLHCQLGVAKESVVTS